MKSNFSKERRDMFRTLPYFPVKAVDGKLVVPGVPSGYVGVKRAT